MASAKMTVQQVLDQLRSTPLQLRELPQAGARAARGPRPVRTSGRPTTCWRTCARAPTRWGEAATRIVAEDDPQLRATNPRVWITKTNYPDLEFAPSLRAFVRQRKQLLAVLDPLQPDDWQRTGTLVGAGKPMT